MPIVKISTNAKEAPAGFVKETISLIAKLLGKPESYCACMVECGKCIQFGNDGELCAFMEVCSIGKLDNSANKKYSKELSEHMKNRLGVAPDKMYIVFKDLDPGFVGYNGGTFA